MDPKRIAGIGMCLALSTCATAGNLCTAGPVIVSPRDVLTDETQVQLIILNEAGQSICGWRPVR